MSFLPFEDFYITTRLTPAEAVERLRGEIEPSRGFSFKKLFNGSSAYYFSGYVFPGKFVIEPIIDYKNSFLPEIKGEIESYEQGCRIHIKMALNQVVFIFMCIWMGFALFGEIAMLYKVCSEREFNFGVFVPVLMLGFAYLLATGGFKFESVDAKNRLLNVFEGEIEGYH